MDFIGKNGANRLELVRDSSSLVVPPDDLLMSTRRQLHGAAKGLEYLHSTEFAHGDLKGVGVSPFATGPQFDRLDIR